MSWVPIDSFRSPDEAAFHSKDIPDGVRFDKDENGNIRGFWEHHNSKVVAGGITGWLPYVEVDYDQPDFVEPRD